MVPGRGWGLLPNAYTIGNSLEVSPYTKLIDFH